MSRINPLEGSRILLVGAGGGLGGALARELESRGAVVVAGVRDPDRLPESTRGGVVRIDLSDAAVITAAAEASRREGPVDYVACAAGVDVRRSLWEHSTAEIDAVLDTDLRGPILLVRAFLPAMIERGRGGLLFYGGFGDGRLAFPYYSVDVAARAGLRSFVESVNREIGGRGPRLTFLGPAVADTAAERPFLGLWRMLGVEPVSAEEVAREAADALASGEELRVMGGPVTRLFARINGWSPRTADALVLGRYTRVLGEAFGAGADLAGRGPDPGSGSVRSVDG